MTLYREVLASSVVDANTLVDKHNPTPVLVRVCEEGLYEFAKVLLEKDATVSITPSLLVSCLQAVIRWICYSIHILCLA